MSPAALLSLCYLFYDLRGNITRALDFVESSNTQYTYDHLDRLERADPSDSTPTMTYTYDAIGNMLSKSEGGESYAFTSYGAGSAGPHALTSALEGTTQHTYEYDQMGNLRIEWVNKNAINPGTAVRQFNWDAEGRIYFKANDTSTIDGMVNFYYDAEGALIRRQQLGWPNPGPNTVYVGGIYEKDLTSGDEILLRERQTDRHAQGRRRCLPLDPRPSGWHRFSDGAIARVTVAAGPLLPLRDDSRYGPGRRRPLDRPALHRPARGAHERRVVQLRRAVPRRPPGALPQRRHDRARRRQPAGPQPLRLRAEQPAAVQ